MNVARALSTEGNREAATLREKIARLMDELKAARAELHQLEDLAHVVGVDLNTPIEPQEVAR